MSRKYKAREIQYFFFVLPAFIIFFVFFFWPIIQTLGYSVTNRKMIPDNTQFVGLKNFVTIFTDTPEFITALKNNIYFTIVVTVLQSLIAFILALALDAKLKGKNFWVNHISCGIYVTAR